MFTFKNKALTISKNDLSESENKTFNSLVNLGDSENIALWTIQHQRKNQSSELYELYNI